MLPPPHTPTTVSSSHLSPISREIPRPKTRNARPKTVATSVGYGYQRDELVCALSESRGVCPSVGIAFVNVSTCEAVLCQFVDTQTYVRLCHKIKVFDPSEIIYASSAANSKLLSIVSENLSFQEDLLTITEFDRRHWCEQTGYEYIQQLALPEDSESLKLALAGKFFAVCSLAAAMKYIDVSLGQTFAQHTLRMKFETSEGAMLIDLSTMANLELVQNLRDAKSKDCLFGLLRQNLTSMGTRLLKGNILQPSTSKSKIIDRYNAVEELSGNSNTLLTLRDVLSGFVDTDKTLAALTLVPLRADFNFMEQAVNNVLMLKLFVTALKPVFQTLTGARSAVLQQIRELCDPHNYAEVQDLLDYALNPDVTYSQKAIDLRAQRVFAIKAGTNGFLDVARKSYLEFVQDMSDLAEDLQEQQKIAIDLKYDAVRQYYLQIPTSEVRGRAQLPEIFINVFRNTKRKAFECQTLELVKLNQKIKDAHNEVMAMSDCSIQELILAVRGHMHPLFKISEAVSLLDMLAGFAHLAIGSEMPYTRPRLTTDTFDLKAARHPISEKIHHQSRTSTTRYIPNDVYATRQKRFQIITGCNMSGKSTYIRSVALITVMAQAGSFVPAEYASLPIITQMFARVATDDIIEANVSTFAAEMREMAFILRNIDATCQIDQSTTAASTTNTNTASTENTPPTRSLIIVDELGRGTSTTDGLTIALAISEALLQSQTSYVWFVTHFRDLAHILSERPGVVNLHMSVNMEQDFSRIKMNYSVTNGAEIQKFYGLALAQMVDLPERVMETAVQVAQTLNERNDSKRYAAGSKTLPVTRRRRLVLELKQALEQLKDHDLDNETLRKRLKHLQQDFAQNMSQIVDAENAPHEIGTDPSVREPESDLSTMTPALDEQEQDAQTSPEKAALQTPSPVKANVRLFTDDRIPNFHGLGKQADGQSAAEDDAVVIETTF